MKKLNLDWQWVYEKGSTIGISPQMKKIMYTIREQQDIFATQCVNVVKNHNRTERESEGVGPDIFILKKLFLELCGPRGNSFR